MSVKIAIGISTIAEVSVRLTCLAPHTVLKNKFVQLR